MNILVIGAGALGGYYGARLAAAGRDVAFLVRQRRAEQIAATGGIVVESPAGNAVVPNPKLVQAGALGGPYDLVLLACKAFDLERCMDDFAPAVGAGTMILPVLNGLRHMDILSARFGKEAVLGGRAMIFATLDDAGRILHQGKLAVLDYGELDGGVSPRIREVDATLSGVGFEARLRDNIMQDLWDKWVLIATVAGSTGLMRATIGDINKAGGHPFMKGLLQDNARVAELNGRRPNNAFMANIESIIDDSESSQMASLAKDMDKGYRIEAEHIFGDLLDRVPAGGREESTRLSTVYACVRAYEVRRDREGC